MNLLQISFSGGIFILAIIAVRAITIRRFPKKTFSILWKIAILRLLVPVSIPSVLSIYTWFNRHSLPVQTATLSPSISVSSADPFDLGSLSIPATVLPQTAPLPDTPKNIPSIWFFVWCIGTVGCAIFFLLSYFICRKNFKTSLPIYNDNVTEWQKEQKQRQRIAIRQLDGITSPLTYGIWKPVILIPKSTVWQDTELKYILAHEYAHIRRQDTLTKLIFILVLCIHWFNPMVWIMYILFNRDIELACDEEVLSQLGESSKTSYALTLIHMEECKSNPTLLYNHFSKNSVEERIRSIMKHKKISNHMIILAFIMIFFLTATFATSPAKAEDKGEMGRKISVSINAAANPAVTKIMGDLEQAEAEGFKLKIEKSFEVSLASGEEIELDTIKTTRGQVLVVTAMCDGIQQVEVRLDGDHLCSGKLRVEKVGLFCSECQKEKEDRILVISNPSSSDLAITIGYCVLEEEEYNHLGNFELLNCLKKEYQKRIK